MALMEFHISREARNRYQVKEVLFSFNGNAILINPSAGRALAHSMNVVRGTENDPSHAIYPGALFAMGLIDEASHALVAYYRKQLDPQVMDHALLWFEEQIGPKALDKLLLLFVEHFPGTAVYNGEQSAAEWLLGTTAGIPHRAAAFEELVLLWLANANPAFHPFQELFQDAALANGTSYIEVIQKLRGYFQTRPFIENMNLLDMLRAPALAAPNSLNDQIAFISKRWAPYLGDILKRLILASDLLKEEELAIWRIFHPPSAEDLARIRRHRGFPDTHHSEVPQYSSALHEYEKFSPDQDWMPTTVLIAKSTNVWLAQLSRQYQRNIYNLDQIPDEELAVLRRRGINALWLIGVWERSVASKNIKRLCGNDDAVASAYSLYDYAISQDLGGESAYVNLRDRAAKFGIRLASDMVPNHMGIDSKWVIEHPEWFLSRHDSPYPGYRFEGPDLSRDDRVEIKIEDHYYEQSDAAVVFRRRDKWTGDIRYIYHGNDGTSFPWNDTAQLNYLSAETREQVIQTILHVARLFPIIRFDAAMTLAKKHIQRLWFPVPGGGGDSIPSRAEFSMSPAAFDAAMPHEFWREVVDRVAAEVPGTLLLAEAFWLLEGYFVRTLGMHRVYNSAFMNMLRDEENAKYRLVLKNTLEFDPEILKRYVNFMSNPDERTAIDQFGTGDKYFGVCTMMATLPGLPMFGHGQIEAFTEKYGMEYYRPRYEETPNEWLVEKHQREIAPLLHNRALFAESENFLLYDFWREDGTVDENVFAYSNRRGNDRALVIYHNRYTSTRGTIHHSAAYQDKGRGVLRQRPLHDGLHIPADNSIVIAYRDLISGLEYLRYSTNLVFNGLSLELHAYSYAVYLNWRQLVPTEKQPWDRLCDSLNGAGVRDLDEALLNLELKPAHDSLQALLQTDLIRKFVESSEHIDIARNQPADSTLRHERKMEEEEFFPLLAERGIAFLEEARKIYRRRTGEVERAGEVPENLTREKLLSLLTSQLEAIHRVPQLERKFSKAWSIDARKVLPSYSPGLNATAVWGPVLAFSVLQLLGIYLDGRNGEKAALFAFDQLHLREPMARAFSLLGLPEDEGWQAAARVKVGTLRAIEGEKTALSLELGLPETLWLDPDLRWLAGVHDADGHRYFIKEAHEELVWWCHLPELLRLAHDLKPSAQAFQEIEKAVTEAIAGASAAGYQLHEEIETPALDVKEGSLTV
jgi:Alpha amylase, catalytic domain